MKIFCCLAINLPVSLGSNLMNLEPLTTHSFHLHGLNAVLLLLTVRIDLCCCSKLWLLFICVTEQEKASLYLNCVQMLNMVLMVCRPFYQLYLCTFFFFTDNIESFRNHDFQDYINLWK